MKIAILYICTGRYNQFFKGFYDSCEKYFLAGRAEKHYFVWTDDLNLSSAGNVHFTYHKCRGFPDDSLFRFDMFLEREEELRSFDYLFFFNANTLFVSDVRDEILPGLEDGGLVGIIGVGGVRYQWIPSLYPYERNKKSTAYISPFGKRYRYYSGAINGGITCCYLKMIKELSYNTRTDYANGIVAIYHDESHLNKYLRTHKCKELGMDYTYPETKQLPGHVKIMLIDKTKYDTYFTKGRDRSLLGRINKVMRRIGRGIQWYF